MQYTIKVAHLHGNYAQPESSARAAYNKHINAYRKDFSRQNLTSLRRQILMSKVSPHNARVKIFIMTVDP